MKSQQTSHRKCQPLGVRCMRSLALFRIFLMIVGVGIIMLQQNQVAANILLIMIGFVAACPNQVLRDSLLYK